jgi:hypothetical protein
MAGTTEQSLPSKSADDWVEAEEKQLGALRLKPAIFENKTRPFFHVDLASALHSVDLYLAANPVTQR